MKRNFWGSGIFFGAKGAVMSALGAENYQQLTPLQSIASSLCASTACIVLTHPYDMSAHRQIKAQQSNAPMPKTNIFNFMSNIVAKEGIRGLSKGLGPKLMGSGLKLAFVASAIDGVTNYILELKNKEEPSSSPQP